MLSSRTARLVPPTLPSGFGAAVGRAPKLSYWYTVLAVASTKKVPSAANEALVTPAGAVATLRRRLTC